MPCPRGQGMEGRWVQVWWPWMATVQFVLPAACPCRGAEGAHGAELMVGGGIRSGPGVLEMAQTKPQGRLEGSGCSGGRKRCRAPEHGFLVCINYLIHKTTVQSFKSNVFLKWNMRYSLCIT